MTQKYVLNRDDSRFTVRVNAAGVLAPFGHSPTLAIRKFSGHLNLDGNDPSNSQFQMTVDPSSLEVTDDMSRKDRDEITRRLEDAVLEPGKYPEAKYETTEVIGKSEGDNTYKLAMIGTLSLHGVEKRLPVTAIVRTRNNEMRMAGEIHLMQSDFDIERVGWSSPFGGQLTVKDEVVMVFDFAGDSG